MADSLLADLLEADDEGDELFFVPMAESSCSRRRRHELRVGLEQGGAAPAAKKKRRKIETVGRAGRFEYEFSEGDPRRFRFDTDKSPWWSLCEMPCRCML